MKINLDEVKFEAVRNGEKINFGGSMSVEMSGEELVQYGNIILNIIEHAKNFVKEEKEFRSKVNERRDLEEIIIKLKKENDKLKLKLDRIKYGSNSVNE